MPAINVSNKTYALACLFANTHDVTVKDAVDSILDRVLQGQKLDPDQVDRFLRRRKAQDRRLGRKLDKVLMPMLRELKPAVAAPDSPLESSGPAPI